MQFTIYMEHTEQTSGHYSFLQEGFQSLGLCLQFSLHLSGPWGEDHINHNFDSSSKFNVRRLLSQVFAIVNNDA